MRYHMLWLFILLPLNVRSAEGQDSACRCQDSTILSQAELARTADSVRAAYRDSTLRFQTELAREADSVRAAYYHTGLTAEKRPGLSD